MDIEQNANNFTLSTPGIRWKRSFCYCNKPQTLETGILFKVEILIANKNTPYFQFQQSVPLILVSGKNQQVQSFV